MTERVLVTGARGFIGRVLSDHLAAHGYQVQALGRYRASGPWTQFFTVDLATSEPIPHTLFEGITTIWHLAGIAHTQKADAQSYYRINVQGTRKLLRAAELAGVQRFIYFSSVKAVATPTKDECVDETWTSWPKDAYGRSKRLAEEHVLQSTIPHVTVLRPALVYGPGVKGNLRAFLRLVASGWCPPLPDTQNRRSFVHVVDVVDAALRVVRSPIANRKVYILSERRFYSTYEIYESVLRLTGRRIPRWQIPYFLFVWLGRVGDLGERLLKRPLPWTTRHVQSLFGSACYRADRIRQELGWRATHTLLSSLEDMLSHIPL